MNQIVRGAVLSDNVGMPFDPEEIRSAERHLIALLEDSDTGKRVMSYTEDAVFMMPGEPPIEGREQMRSRAKTRLHSVSLIPLTTEGNERFASVYAASAVFWVNRRRVKASL